MDRDPLFEFLSDEMPVYSQSSKFCVSCKWFHFDDNTQHETCSCKASSFYKEKVAITKHACRSYSLYNKPSKTKKKRSRKLLLIDG